MEDKILATAVMHCVAALGLIDTPGGAEWRRIKWQVKKIIDAIDYGAEAVEDMTDEEINELWNIK